MVLTFYLDILDADISYFDKKEFEKLSEEQITEIKQREDQITAMLKSIHGEINAKEGV